MRNVVLHHSKELMHRNDTLPGNPVYKPHLLIYAHYYDTAATAQLLRDLAEGMLDSFWVTVICAVPSYLGTIEEKWKTQKYYREKINGVNVLRVAVPEFTKSDKKSRVKNILAYFFRAMDATRKVGRVDYILSVSQPPVLGGLSGVWGKWILKNSNSGHPKYIYQIQDFNPEQILAVGYCKNKAVTGFMMILDKFSCRRADLIITVGRDLLATIDERFPNGNAPKSVLINNWVDEKEVYPLNVNHPGVLKFKKKFGLENKFIFMYSGNIGLYYDLGNLMKVIERFPAGTKTVPCEQYPDGREVAFVFVGAGAVLKKLMNYKKKHRMDNVIFISYQDREDLIYSLNAGDVHWCVNAKGMKGVSAPSKAYGIMAAGKPMLGVLERETEVRLLIEESGCGKCSTPGDYAEIEKLVKWFIDHAENDELKKMGMSGRKYLTENLTKDMSIEKYKKEILRC